MKLTFSIINGEPCYCSECDAPNACRLIFENPKVVQHDAAGALCLDHTIELRNGLDRMIGLMQKLTASSSLVSRDDE